MAESEHFLSRQAYAITVGCAPETVSKDVMEGRLPAIFIGNQLRIPIDDDGFRIAAPRAAATRAELRRRRRRGEATV